MMNKTVLLSKCKPKYKWQPLLPISSLRKSVVADVLERLLTKAKWLKSVKNEDEADLEKNAQKVKKLRLAKNAVVAVQERLLMRLILSQNVA